METQKDKILVDIYGSCVSRIPFLEGNLTATGCSDPRIKINMFYDRHPILSCMTPVPNTKALNVATIENISKDELYSKTDRQLRCVKQELLKSTLPLMMESKAEYLVFDLYSFHSNLIVHKDTMFSPYSYEFFNTNIYQENPSEFSQTFFPLDLPMGIWWGYVKAFCDFVFQKYRNDHVIMLRFKACSGYLSNSKEVCLIPERCRRPWQANDKYNRIVREIEDKIIELYQPHVIDYTKYFIGDESLHGSDVQGAHYEKEYYIESFKKIKELLFGISGGGGTSQRIYRTSRLSNVGIAKLLGKELSQEQFIKMWQLIESPLKALKDDLIFSNLVNLTDAEVILNRFLISKIFSMADEMAYVLENNIFSDDEKRYLFGNFVNVGFNGVASEKEKVLIEKIFTPKKTDVFFSVIEKDTFDNTFEKFKVLLENSNLAWIDYLMTAEKQQPDNLLVIQHMLYYAQAIEDEELVNYYTRRLQQLQ